MSEVLRQPGARYAYRSDKHHIHQYRLDVWPEQPCKRFKEGVTRFRTCCQPCILSFIEYRKSKGDSVLVESLGTGKEIGE